MVLQGDIPLQTIIINFQDDAPKIWLGNLPNALLYITV